MSEYNINEEEDLDLILVMEWLRAKGCQLWAHRMIGTDKDRKEAALWLLSEVDSINAFKDRALNAARVLIEDEGLSSLPPKRKRKKDTK